MANGMKRNETRSWPTSHRGDLVICAAKHRVTLEDLDGDMGLYMKAMSFPIGCALCVVELFDCVPTERFTTQTVGADSLIALDEAEADLGDYTPGRFAWRTRNVRRLPKPISLRGFQGIWNLDAKIEAEINAALLNNR